MRNRIKTGLIICSVVYTIFEGSVSLATPALVDLMGQQVDLRNETVSYIRQPTSIIKKENPLKSNAVLI